MSTASSRPFLVSSVCAALLAAAAHGQPQLAVQPDNGFPATLSTFGMTVADVDGDGVVDALFEDNLGTVRVYLNDGDGAFAELPGAFPALRIQIDGVIPGDVDGDGDCDAVVLEARARARLFLNRGDGTFVENDEGLPATANNSFLTGALFDVEGDGDLDLVLGASPLSHPHRLMINDGAGRFTDETVGRMPASVGWARAVTVGDINVDGRPDLYFASNADADALFIQDSAGRFHNEVVRRMPILPTTSAAALLTDLDGDGAPDLVHARTGGTTRVLTMYHNDGAGFFEETQRLTLSPAIFNVFVDDGDLDQDGDVDLVVGTANQQTLVLLNDGAGKLAIDPSRVGGEATLTAGIAVADVDRDGDLDVIEANGLVTVPTLLRTNRHRQLAAMGDPVEGARWGMQLFSQPGYGVTPGAVVPVVSTAQAALPLGAIGTLLVDPNRAVVLPEVPLPPSQGAALSLSIPGGVGLAGTTLYVQAFFLEGAAVRASNRVRGVVQP